MIYIFNAMEVCKTSWNLRLQTNFHGIKYINLIYIYYLLLL